MNSLDGVGKSSDILGAQRFLGFGCLLRGQHRFQKLQQLPGSGFRIISTHNDTYNGDAVQAKAGTSRLGYD